MAARKSPERRFMVGKRQATDGEWKTPDRIMTEASADPTPETIHITYDYAYRCSNKGRRRAAKGFYWTLRLQLREDGAVHKGGASMPTWTVDPPGRTTGACGGQGRGEDRQADRQYGRGSQSRVSIDATIYRKCSALEEKQWPERASVRALTVIITMGVTELGVLFVN